MRQNLQPPGTQEKAGVASALLRLAETIAGQSRLESLLPLIVQLTCEALCGQICLLSLWDEQRARFVPAASIGLSARLQRLFYRLPVAAGDIPLVDEMVRSRSPVIVEFDDPLVTDALRRFSGHSTALTENSADCAVLGVPLLHHDQVLGGMLLFADKECLGSTELALITGIARQTALAVASARTFEAERRRRRDLEMLRETIAILTTELELETLYQRIVERAVLTFAAPASALFLWDGIPEAPETLSPVATHGLAADSDGQHRLSSDLIAGFLRARAELRPVVLPDLWLTSLGDADRLRDQRLRSAMVIPLVRGERFVGLIQVYAPAAPAIFDDDAQALAQAFAHQAVIALDNARLCTALQTERERWRALSARLTQAQEAERTRIARELHDEAGQALTTVRLQLDYLASALPPDLPSHLRQQVTEAQAIVGRTLVEIRRISVALRPSLLDDLGLTPALRWQCDRLSRHTEIKVDFDSKQDVRRLTPDIETAVYRAAQEALTNIARHAQATSVQVSLECQDDHLCLTIADDGKGFPDTADQGFGLGLIGMQERLSSVGGTLRIDSRPGAGTTLYVEVPL